MNYLAQNDLINVLLLQVSLFDLQKCHLECGSLLINGALVVERSTTAFGLKYFTCVHMSST